jgi:hypothetical protein
MGAELRHIPAEHCGVPDLLNRLNRLKDDKARRRIAHPDPVFRRSILDL